MQCAAPSAGHLRPVFGLAERASEPSAITGRARESRGRHRTAVGTAGPARCRAPPLALQCRSRTSRVRRGAAVSVPVQARSRGGRSRDTAAASFLTHGDPSPRADRLNSTDANRGKRPGQIRIGPAHRGGGRSQNEAGPGLPPGACFRVRGGCTRHHAQRRFCVAVTPRLPPRWFSSHRCASCAHASSRMPRCWRAPRHAQHGAPAPCCGRLPLCDGRARRPACCAPSVPGTVGGFGTYC